MNDEVRTPTLPVPDETFGEWIWRMNQPDYLPASSGNYAAWLARMNYEGDRRV